MTLMPQLLPHHLEMLLDRSAPGLDVTKVGVRKAGAVGMTAVIVAQEKSITIIVGGMLLAHRHQPRPGPGPQGHRHISHVQASCTCTWVQDASGINCNKMTPRDHWHLSMKLSAKGMPDLSLYPIHGRSRPSRTSHLGRVRPHGGRVGSAHSGPHSLGR